MDIDDHESSNAHPAEKLSQAGPIVLLNSAQHMHIICYIMYRNLIQNTCYTLNLYTLHTIYYRLHTHTAFATQNAPLQLRDVTAHQPDLGLSQVRSVLQERLGRYRKVCCDTSSFVDWSPGRFAKQTAVKIGTLSSQGQ